MKLFIFTIYLAFSISIIHTNQFNQTQLDCSTLGVSAPLTPELSEQILDQGNSPQCYIAITEIVPYACDFINTGLSYADGNSSYTLLTQHFVNLIENSDDLISDCGIYLGDYNTKTTNYDEEYCLSNINNMISYGLLLMDNRTNLNIAIPALNDLYFYLSYAINTCGGIQNLLGNQTTSGNVVDE